MIEVEGLRKTYGDFAAVVDSTFSVAEGEVFGIVGPNGAGKTTTLKVLAGLVDPSDGEVEVAGFASDDPEMRRQLGFLPEESPLYEEMTPLSSYLRFFADLYDVPRKAANERIEAALDRLELDHRERRLGDMSKGMKRKVAIARSLVNDPDVLVYDEPASGLDPVTTNSVLEFTRELRSTGKTVVFSAHNLYHVESVCDRVAVMDEGRSSPAAASTGSASDDTAARRPTACSPTTCLRPEPTRWQISSTTSTPRSRKSATGSARLSRRWTRSRRFAKPPPRRAAAARSSTSARESRA